MTFEEWYINLKLENNLWVKELLQEAFTVGLELGISGCEQYRNIVIHKFPEIFQTYFICGESGEKDKYGLPDIITVCPAYGCDWSIAYKKVVNKEGI